MDNLKKRFPIYSKIIGLYPPRYRQEYGQQMLQTTADMLDNAPKRGSRTLIWLRVTLDLPPSITKQQLQYSGGIYMKDTPSYIKASGIISSLLLLPFFAALAANGLDKVINNHTLLNSWLWKTPVLGLWVIELPLIAFGLAAGSYLLYLTKYKKMPWIKRILDIRRSWPIVLPAAVAFGILFLIAFHDSAQCWMQTPTHFVTHVNQTWQCTAKNQSLPILF